MTAPFKLKLDCSRGAPMGRCEGLYVEGGYFRGTTCLSSDHAPVKMHLARVPINSGGYDAGGAYWGLGDPLYCAWSEDPDLIVYVRAHSRKKAKSEVLEDHPFATFYR